jgi:hypothetical protein
LTAVTVHSLEDPIEHAVQMQVFKKWPARDGGSPSDRAERAEGSGDCAALKNEHPFTFVRVGAELRVLVIALATHLPKRG